MLISVLGLGVEGKYAVKSFLKENYKVYGTDLNKNIKLNTNNPNLEIELGKHDFDKIFNSYGVSISPSLFHLPITKEIINKNLFISDILNNHKNIKTIAVTGTNGKTTTTHMIYEILKNAGYKVAIGGNAGGGFKGYNDLLLKTNKKKYDFILIETCDMTLDFCNYMFNIDYVVVTNIGRDHLNYHKSIENYKEEIKEFIKGKTAILNEEISKNQITFTEYNKPLKLFGKFNLKNADAANKLAIELGISQEIIDSTLQSFTPVEGRTIEINHNNKKIIAGKTDNIDALKAVLDEEKFDTIIFGTARSNEDCRFLMIDYIASYDCENLVIFPGLDDLTEKYYNKLTKLGFKGNIQIIKDKKNIIKFINNQPPSNILIGGNGQKKIIELTKEITYSKN